MNVKVGDRIPVRIYDAEDDAPRHRGQKTEMCEVVYVHPLGRFLTVRTPYGFNQTLWPEEVEK